MTSTGFPHSEISGSTPVCGSPKLIAANHVLHRLLTPRHSPCALSSLATNFIRNPERVPNLLALAPAGKASLRSGRGRRGLPKKGPFLDPAPTPGVPRGPKSVRLRIGCASLLLKCDTPSTRLRPKFDERIISLRLEVFLFDA